MIDWTAVVEGLGLLGAALMAFFKLRQATVSNRARLKAHEDSCGERYEEISATMQRIEHRLQEQDRVSDQRNLEAQQHREGVQIELGRIRTSIAVLEENKRMRERHEDHA